MKKIPAVLSVAVLAMGLTWPDCIPGETEMVEVSGTAVLAGEVIVEGYSDWKLQKDDRAEELLKEQKKKATAESTRKAKIILANRAALADARRKVLEYQQGVTFIFAHADGHLERLETRSQGTVQGDSIKQLSGKVFDSGLVMRRVSCPRKVGTGARGGIRVFEVTGQAPGPRTSVALAASDARADAIGKVIRRVAAEKFGGELPDKTTGKLYEVETLSDRLEDGDYSVRIRVAIALD